MKVGHTGTLDPLATGLMIVVVGSYCKRAEQFSKLDKTYEVTMRLGHTSTTGDNEGEKIHISDEIPPETALKNTVLSFRQTYDQVPPVYSAIKIDGKRAYKLARQGIDLKLEPRKVTIHRIDFTEYDYPEVRFTAAVSSGTYIRSLVEDIGQKLGTGAYMTALRRITVGDFNILDAVSPADISSQYIERTLAQQGAVC